LFVPPLEKKNTKFIHYRSHKKEKYKRIPLEATILFIFCFKSYFLFVISRKKKKTWWTR